MRGSLPISEACRNTCNFRRHDEMTAHGFRTTACNLLAGPGFGSDAIELRFSALGKPPARAGDSCSYDRIQLTG
jgi:hypothetical protein